MELPASSCSCASSGVSSCLLWGESHTWKHGHLREARSQAGEPQIVIILNHQWQALKMQSANCFHKRWLSKSCLHCLKSYLGEAEGGWVTTAMVFLYESVIRCRVGDGNWLSSVSFLATEGMNWFTGKVLGLVFFYGGVENKDSVCNLMPSGGSQLAFRTLRFQCATDQKWAWSVSHQNTHRSHFKEAWIMHEALRGCSVLLCHRWAVHGISGGLVVPSCCVAGGYVSWAAGRCGDWKQTCVSGSGCSAHQECTCRELSRATNVELKGADFFPYRCRPLCSGVKQL